MRIVNVLDIGFANSVPGGLPLFRCAAGLGVGGGRPGVGAAADHRALAETGGADSSQECFAAAAGGGL